MLETTKKLLNEVEEFMKLGMSTLDVTEMLEGMDETTFKMYKLMLNMIDTSKELAVKQAELMEEQDKKLDKILKLVEKK